LDAGSRLKALHEERGRRGDKQPLKRKPHQSELDYFKKNPGVSGMAASDNKVILNPYSDLTDEQYQSVYKNESARIYMRENGGPDFEITDKQKEAFSNYGSLQNIKDTIAARILSGDPSALDVTDEQREYAGGLVKSMSETDKRRNALHEEWNRRQEKLRQDLSK